MDNIFTPPGPIRDVDWTEFPNEWDLKYWAWRERIEEFSLALREAFREAQRVPVAQYNDGDVEVKWDGKLYPVSKPFYKWLHGHRFGRDGDLAAVLLEATMARSAYARKAR